MSAKGALVYRDGLTSKPLGGKLSSNVEKPSKGRKEVMKIRAVINWSLSR